MGKKCCIFGCNSNYYGAESASVFNFQKTIILKTNGFGLSTGNAQKIADHLPFA